jgi:hypothetical protein
MCQQVREAEIETTTVRGFLLANVSPLPMSFLIVFIHGHGKLNCHQTLSNFFHEPKVQIVNDIM